VIGNDIVDLAEAKKASNWKRNGFLGKVFTLKEQKCISNFESPDLMVWLLWSMKESAYKIFVQENFRSFLAPLKFECSLEKCSGEYFSGKVVFENKNYSTNSFASADKISTIAYLDKTFPENFISSNFEFSADTFLTRKYEMLSKFFPGVSKFIKKASEELSIKKDDLNVPFLFYKGKYLKSSISFSHHGRYGAYAAEFF
jgi:phosphopantetheinyl transferase (holo-ACP synthase)